ncbi:MAG: pantoate--beta-alanine ligase [Methylococcales bacterium]|nr:pantoate--beta-alanine ligase [Methylococcales bacterium]
MQKVTSVKALRDIVQQWKQQGLCIAFVPTMGNLHAGHIKLVTEAKKKADRIVVSIFVNPTQFGVGEDFKSYPRTEELDQELLNAASADLLFLPTVLEMYPQQSKTVVSVADLSQSHCGAHRVGHFDGVATVVAKLFNIVQPDLAVFGEKDFQQLLVIKQMVKDLNMAIDIIGVATERESDGLAMSSRNAYLSKQQRLVAVQMYLSLCKAKESVLSAEQGMSTTESQQQKCLENFGFKVDYFSICRNDNLQQATDTDEQIVILVAAKLGSTRLIDNICFNRNPTIN